MTRSRLASRDLVMLTSTGSKTVADVLTDMCRATPGCARRSMSMQLVLTGGCDQTSGTAGDRAAPPLLSRLVTHRADRRVARGAPGVGCGGDLDAGCGTTLWRRRHDRCGHRRYPSGNGPSGNPGTRCLR